MIGTILIAVGCLSLSGAALILAMCRAAHLAEEAMAAHARAAQACPVQPLTQPNHEKCHC